MVETNEINTNLTENSTEITLIEEEPTKEESIMTSNDILHSASIDNDKKGFSRVVQIIGARRQENRNENDMAENSNNDDMSVIHEFDATVEDPFTLESFDTLIQQHADKDKDFIIARVTTVDPLNESKHYYSYYSGHHINKVLFRTQPDQGLLHRMKAKNPLNNMNIIGDVLYYVVKATSVKKSQTFAKSSSMSTASKKTLRVKDNDVTIMATSSLDKTENDFTEINMGSNINKLHSAPPSIWNFENEDDDEKVAIEMEPFSIKSYKRWSADGSVKPLPKAFTANHSSHNHNSSTPDGENLEKLLTTLKSQTFNNINDGQSSKVIKNDLSSPSENNENNENNEDNKNNNKNNENNKNNKYNESNESNENDEDSDTITLSPTELISANGRKDFICYKATFYATDDDFLMRSSVRQYFKVNAMDPIDAQLFMINTLPHSNSHATTTIDGTTPSARLERMVASNGTFLIDPMVIGSTQSHNDSRTMPNVSGSRWRRILNNLRMNKGLRWLVLMYMIFGFLLIRFVVSETYAYLMAFLLMLCLFLVFCVGSGVGVWGR